jgi:hypothetical protein
MGQKIGHYPQIAFFSRSQPDSLHRVALHVTYNHLYLHIPLGPLAQKDQICRRQN